MYLDTFGKRLRVLRQDQKLSQVDMRDAIDNMIGETYISELERTEKMPSLEVAAAMAKVLNVTLDYLALLIDEAEPLKRSSEADYMTPEADAVASLIDEMSIDQRTLMLEVARNMSSSNARQRRLDESIEILDSIERKWGLTFRREIETLIRKGSFGDDSTT
jgi:transcriptional regulator with XRE-family HTH domain